MCVQGGGGGSNTKTKYTKYFLNIFKEDLYILKH